jgi:hypothetical protein
MTDESDESPHSAGGDAPAGELPEQSSSSTGRSARRRAGIILAVLIFVFAVVAAGLAIFRPWKTSGLAECVVGRWIPTKSVVTLSMDGASVSATLAGDEQEFTSDGRLIWNYTGTTTTTVEVADHVMVITMDRPITATYTIDGDDVVYKDLKTSGTPLVTLDDNPFDLDDATLRQAMSLPERERLTCSDRKLTQHGTQNDRRQTSTWTVELTREG